MLARVSDGALVLDCRTLGDADAARISAPAMTEEQAAALTLGTAGHIDHGKTALVRALTGVDTDRLPEEQARGISIALGYASLPLPSGRALSVVDVPGHERFVRTMISGATGIDLALSSSPATTASCRRRVSTSRSSSCSACARPSSR